MELNPNHPALQELREEWQKIAAVMVYMMGGEVTINDNLFLELPEKFAVAIFRGENYLRLKMITQEEALALAKREGGLPN